MEALLAAGYSEAEATNILGGKVKLTAKKEFSLKTRWEDAGHSIRCQGLVWVPFSQLGRDAGCYPLKKTGYLVPCGNKLKPGCECCGKCSRINLKWGKVGDELPPMREFMEKAGTGKKLMPYYCLNDGNGVERSLDDLPPIENKKATSKKSRSKSDSVKLKEALELIALLKASKLQLEASNTQLEAEVRRLSIVPDLELEPDLEQTTSNDSQATLPFQSPPIASPIAEEPVVEPVVEPVAEPHHSAQSPTSSEASSASSSQKKLKKYSKKLKKAQKTGVQADIEKWENKIKKHNN